MTLRECLPIRTKGYAKTVKNMLIELPRAHAEKNKKGGDRMRRIEEEEKQGPFFRRDKFWERKIAFNSATKFFFCSKLAKEKFRNFIKFHFFWGNNRPKLKKSVE